MIIVGALVLVSYNAIAQKDNAELSDEDRLHILQLLIYSDVDPNELIGIIDRNWEEGMIAPLVEIYRLTSDRILFRKINRLLKEKTGQKHNEFFEWMDWLWEKQIPNTPYYYDFKADLYRSIDEKFVKYFADRKEQSRIQLEEVVWGGVVQDGIPPLRYPSMINATEAQYLEDDHVVFGLYINGVAKAYPKRILAWHEMFIDYFGELEIAGVYCTLCGTLIPYHTEYNGIRHELGTSGFLFRSNKLMYDKETQSLWNTIEGSPVLGPLAKEDIKLDVFPVVTTTWGAWKGRHPNTKVLSPHTGHRRDYGEGVAYQQYFSTDELMFPVPVTDKRLKNKDQVMIPRISGYESDPLAISIKYLKKKKWHKDQIGNQKIVIIIDQSHAVRVYDASGVDFESFHKGSLRDSQGRSWQVKDTFLIDTDGQKLLQLPSHNTFWFAWVNSYPETRLVH